MSLVLVHIQACLSILGYFTATADVVVGTHISLQDRSTVAISLIN